MEGPRITFIVDMKSVDFDLQDNLINTPQLDFGHQVLFIVNNSKHNIFGNVKCYLRTHRDIIFVSPAYNVPETYELFEEDLRTVLTEGKISNGTINLMQKVKSLPSLPKSSIVINPRANTTGKPQAFIREPTVIHVSLDPQGLEGQEVCFSMYPLSPVVQVAGIVTELAGMSK